MPLVHLLTCVLQKEQLAHRLQKLVADGLFLLPEGTGVARQTATAANSEAHNQSAHKGTKAQKHKSKRQGSSSCVKMCSPFFSALRRSQFVDKDNFVSLRHGQPELRLIGWGGGG